MQEGQAKQADASPYLGGQIHQAASGQRAHVAVVGQGASVADDKAVAVQAVLCAAMGETGGCLFDQKLHGIAQNNILKPEPPHNCCGVSVVLVSAPLYPGEIWWKKFPKNGGISEGEGVWFSQKKKDNPKFWGQYTRNENIAQPGSVHAEVFKAANHDPFQLKPLNLTHSDTGLVGFYLSAEGTRVQEKKIPKISNL